MRGEPIRSTTGGIWLGARIRYGTCLVSADRSRAVSSREIATALFMKPSIRAISSVLYLDERALILLRRGPNRPSIRSLNSTTFSASTLILRLSLGLRTLRAYPCRSSRFSTLVIAPVVRPVNSASLPADKGPNSQSIPMHLWSVMCRPNRSATVWCSITPAVLALRKPFSSESSNSVRLADGLEPDGF